MGGREAALAFGGGAVFGAVSGCVAQFLFFIALHSSGGGICFILSACVIVFALSVLGAILAEGDTSVLLLLGDPVARLVGTSILGSALGYAIGLVEEKARVSWLEVRHGRSGETVRVSLGSEPVCVESNSQRCAICAQGARPVALRFRYVDGQVFCDDMARERTTAVDPGYEAEVGSVHLAVRGGKTTIRLGDGSRGGPETPPPLLESPRPAPPPPQRPITIRPAAGGVTRPVVPIPTAVATRPSGHALPAGGPNPPPRPPPPRKQ